MPFNYTYQSAMNGVGELAFCKREPGYVRAQAFAILRRELSPANPKSREIHHALGIEPHPEPAPRPNHSHLPEAPLTPEQQKDFHLNPIFQVYDEVMALVHGDDVPFGEDEESTEEEDEPQ